MEGEAEAEEDNEMITMVDNAGGAIEREAVAMDSTGEGHGKLVRNLMEAKQVR